MSAYEVTIHSSSQVSYLVDASSEDEAQEKAGELWASDAEPDDEDGGDVDSVEVRKVG